MKFVTCFMFYLTVMISVFALRMVNPGFEPRSSQTKDYLSGICCFSTMYTRLRSQSEGWLPSNQDNVS
jgi:hypothetical protein